MSDVFSKEKRSEVMKAVKKQKYKNYGVKAYKNI